MQFAGKRTGGAPSKRNRHTKKGPRGSGTKPPSGPPPHRTQRTHRRDDRGSVDLDSRPRLRLAPQEGMFSQRSIRAKQRNLNDLSKWLKAIEEASARQGPPALADVPGAGGDVSAPQRGFTKGLVQSGVSYAPWTAMQHFSTAAVYPTFSDRQRYGGFISAQVFGAQYGQHLSGMASPNQPASQHQYPADMRNSDARSVPALGAGDNARAHAHVKMGTISVQPAPRREVHAHAAADSRVVAAKPLSRSSGDPAPSSVYPGHAQFGEHDLTRADILAGYPAPVKSATVCVEVGCDRIGDVSDADSWAADMFACPDGPIRCDTPVMNIGLESQPDSGSTYHAPPTGNASNPSASAEWSPSPYSLPTSTIDSEICLNTPREGPRVPMSTYSSLDGAVSEALLQPTYNPYLS